MDNVEISVKDSNHHKWQDYWQCRNFATRNEVVLEYLDLVKKIIMRLKGSYNNYGQLDDMISQGVIALIDAVEKYDPKMGAKFETFATLKIRGAAIDFMRKQDWISKGQRTLVKELEEVYNELYADLGREPAQSEIAERMDLDISHLDKILQQRHDAILLSYEEAINEKMMVALPLIDGNSSEGAPEADLLRGELKQNLIGAIDTLNERERTVISLYYYEELKLKEIAEVLEVTESRVSQIHSVAIIKMKHKLSAY